MVDGWEVSPQALRGHAGLVGRVAEDVELCRAAAVRVSLGREAYGQLCQFLPSMLDETTTAGVDALSEAAGSVREAGEALQAVAKSYERVDDDASAGVTRAGSGMAAPG